VKFIIDHLLDIAILVIVQYRALIFQRYNIISWIYPFCPYNLIVSSCIDGKNHENKQQ